MIGYLKFLIVFFVTFNIFAYQPHMRDTRFDEFEQEMYWNCVCDCIYAMTECINKQIEEFRIAWFNREQLCDHNMHKLPHCVAAVYKAVERLNDKALQDSFDKYLESLKLGFLTILMYLNCKDKSSLSKLYEIKYEMHERIEELFGVLRNKLPLGVPKYGAYRIMCTLTKGNKAFLMQENA